MRDPVKAVLWLHGLLAGFCIKRALEIGVPSLIFIHGETGVQPPLHGTGPLFTFKILGCILVVTVLAVRFFWGAMHYFESSYSNEESDRKALTFDVLIGTLHFCILYGMALSLSPAAASPEINIINEKLFGEGRILYDPFLFMLVAFLLFDLPWWVSKRPWRKGKSIHGYVLPWMLYNAATAVLVVMLAAVGLAIGQNAWHVTYIIALASVILLSIWDLSCTARGETPLDFAWRERGKQKSTNGQLS